MALDGAAARRRRRPRRRDPVAARDLGGLGPPARTSPTRWSTAATATSASALDKLDDPDVCPNCGAKHSFTEARQFNLMFKTHAGPGRGGRRRGLPAARDGPGHVHQLRQRAADEPQEAAVRHRPDRQVVPQRDHARQLRVPHPRVRADGDGVLRPARRGRSSGTSTGASERLPLVPRPRHPRPTSCGCGPTTPTS